MGDAEQRRAQEAEANREDYRTSRAPGLNRFRDLSLSKPLGTGEGAGQLIDVLNVGPDAESTILRGLHMQDVGKLAEKAGFSALERKAFAFILEGEPQSALMASAGCTRRQAEYAIKRVFQKLRIAAGHEAKPKPGRPRVPKEEQRRRQSERIARRKRELHEQGLCTCCGKRPRGKLQKCETCREVSRKRNAERAATGVCWVCGFEVETPGRKRCSICDEKDADRQARQREERRLFTSRFNATIAPLARHCEYDGLTCKRLARARVIRHDGTPMGQFCRLHAKTVMLKVTRMDKAEGWSRWKALNSEGA